MTTNEKIITYVVIGLICSVIGYVMHITSFPEISMGTVVDMHYDDVSTRTGIYLTRFRVNNTIIRSSYDFYISVHGDYTGILQLGHTYKFTTDKTSFQANRRLVEYEEI